MKVRKPTQHALIAERTRLLDAITESTAQVFWLSAQIQKHRDAYPPLKKQFDDVQAQLKAFDETKT